MRSLKDYRRATLMQLKVTRLSTWPTRWGHTSTDCTRASRTHFQRVHLLPITQATQVS